MAADLNAMRIKVRRLTRSPSESQLSDDQIDEYINTFYIYDLPEELRLFALKRTLTWYCEPNKDVYPTDSVPALQDFLNKYITVEPPVYIAGNLAFYGQSREEFYNLYPQISFRQTVDTGDGTTTNYSGTLSNLPLVQNQLSFSSVGESPLRAGLVVSDLPLSNELGSLIDQDNNVVGNINYITGEYDFFFSILGIPIAPENGEIIQAQYLAYKASMPIAVLFYGNEFTLRPIPDRPYKIVMDAFVRPTAFDGDPFMVPFLEEWWQLLSYGAAKKIFEDRSDIDSVQLILPELENQKDLILRRTLVQKSTQLPATIYNQRGFPGWWYGNNGTNY